MNKSLQGVIAKMKCEQIKDFSKGELDRVFKDVVSKKACIRGVDILINKYDLTIEKLYNNKI